MNIRLSQPLFDSPKPPSSRGVISDFIIYLSSTFTHHRGDLPRCFVGRLFRADRTAWKGGPTSSSGLPGRTATSCTTTGLEKSTRPKPLGSADARHYTHVHVSQVPRKRFVVVCSLQ